MNHKVTRIISLLHNGVTHKELEALGFSDEEITEAYRLLELMAPKPKPTNDSKKPGRKAYGGLSR